LGFGKLFNLKHKGDLKGRPGIFKPSLVIIYWIWFLGTFLGGAFKKGLRLENATKILREPGLIPWGNLEKGIFGFGAKKFLDWGFQFYSGKPTQI